MAKRRRQKWLRCLFLSLRAPGKTGPLHIVDASGGRLGLRSDGGATFYFDVESRQFAASP
jgi:hypothetical protein